MKIFVLFSLLGAVALRAASFEFDDPSPPSNAPIFFTAWRYQVSGPVQLLIIPAPTNPPPRTVKFSAVLPLGTNTISVTAQTATDKSAYSNLFSFTNTPATTPISLRLAPPLKANISLVVTGAVTFTE